MNKLIEEYIAIRKKRKISQLTISKQLRIPQSHISAIENGKVDPRLTTFTDLASLAGVVPVLIPRERYHEIKGLLSENEDQRKIILEDLE